MLLFMGLLMAAFGGLVKPCEFDEGWLPLSTQFVIWALGAILFAHAMTFWSISYFDQTIGLSLSGAGLYWLLPIAAEGVCRRACAGKRADWLDPGAAETFEPFRFLSVFTTNYLFNSGLTYMTNRYCIHVPA